MLKVVNNTTRYRKNVYLEYTFFLYLVVLLTTFNIYKFHTHNGDDIPYNQPNTAHKAL